MKSLIARFAKDQSGVTAIAVPLLLSQRLLDAGGPAEGVVS